MFVYGVTVLWAVAPCNLVKYGRFGGTCLDTQWWTSNPVDKLLNFTVLNMTAAELFETSVGISVSCTVCAVCIHQ